MGNRIYPIGIQNFEKIRTSGYVYVDKTALIHRMVSSGSYYFLSRPRRFGKSLLVSTLEAYFHGKRELFEGLEMEKLEQEWVKRPVLHLDLNIGKYDAADSLDKMLNDAVSKWEKIYGTEETESTLALRFAGILQRAYQQSGQRVAILIDEYDKPLLQAIGNHDLQREYRNTLKPFYGVLKTMDGCIQFTLLTGVTKFGKVSDMNNLEDITMRRQYVSLCGMTEQEIHDNFEEHLCELSETQGMSYKETCDKLRASYGGYHFAPNSEGIYNPFSLLNTFYKMKYANYWFEYGTPTYLVELLKLNHYNLKEMANEEISSDVLNSIYSDEEPLPIIVQSGYLTIKGYDKRFDLYKLGFPNREVEEGFGKSLISLCANYSKYKSRLKHGNL